MTGFTRLFVSAATAALLAVPALAADFTLRVHTLVQSPHPYNDIADYIKEKLEAGSDGRIAVRIFTAGQLGQDPAVISEMALGTIDLMISTTSNGVQQIPEYAIFTMPYIFPGMDEMRADLAPDSPIFKHFEQVYQDRGLGMKLLALGASGTRNVATDGVVVNGPGDLKGLKMRTPPTPMDAEVWAALGMLPVTVAWGELYAAMQTGVAQAMESSLPGYDGSKLYEVAPNLALTAHTIQVNHTSMSQASWNKLPEDLQQLVWDVAQEANQHGIDMALKYDSELVESLIAEHNVSVTRPDKQEFIAILGPVQEKLAQDLDLVEEYQIIQAAVAD
ncbi:MAG: TRAP transporter substrate-binding protein [Tropicimonas sp.]|uniref:TRAP transporter substrate-binding protein n=1 Tax=Tropicimonas sp. TaxID=2067044 RepID=UPI003A88A9EE